MDPIRNPYAPGAGQRPPELAGRDRELEQFEVTLERVAAGASIVGLYPLSDARRADFEAWRSQRRASDPPAVGGDQRPSPS